MIGITIQQTQSRSFAQLVANLLPSSISDFGDESISRGGFFEAKNIFGDVDKERVKLTLVPPRENVRHFVVTQLQQILSKSDCVESSTVCTYVCIRATMTTKNVSK